MELRQLAYVEAVVRCGGFTRAAEDLRVAQPAVSAQVRSLERELGVRLFARTTRRVALTEAGELFLVRARRVLAELDAARAEAADLAAVVRGRVVVGMTGVAGEVDLPTTIAGFARAHPQVSLSIRTGLLPDLLDALAAATVDLVVGPLEPGLPASVETHRLADDRMVLIAPPGRLAAGRVDLVGLRGEPFVALPAGTGLRTLLETHVPGVRVPYEVGTAAHVRGLVAAGLGPALMPASAVVGPGPEVDVHDTDPAVPHPPFGLIWREPLGPAAGALHAAVVGSGD